MTDSKVIRLVGARAVFEASLKNINDDPPLRAKLYEIIASLDAQIEDGLKDRGDEDILKKVYYKRR